jgi:type III pantothenate kinase
MILELDIGNSRIKWRLLETPKSGILSKGLLLNLDEFKARFVNQQSITKVRIASVREDDFLAEMTGWIKQRWSIKAEVAQVVRDCNGLRIGYEDLTRLGVDRWLAMLAAYEDSQTACMVVDCGTAVTLDIIDATGEHIGGYIVPGVQLLPKALANNTAIRLSDFEPDYILALGNSTGEAVYNGALSMLVAFIEKTIAQESTQNQGDSEYPVYLTGGDADLICQHLAPIKMEIKVIPGLVFDGLSIAL